MAVHVANVTSFKKGERAKNWNGFRKGNIPYNGITLCRECHYLLHADKQLQEAGWYMKGGE